MSTPRCMQAVVPQGSVLSSTLHSLYINDIPQAIGVNLALFAEDPSLYATESKECYVLRNVRRGISSMSAWCECWYIKINENKTRAIYLFRQMRPPDSLLILNGWNMPFLNSVKYLGVIFDKRMTRRSHTASTTMDTSSCQESSNPWTKVTSKRGRSTQDDFTREAKRSKEDSHWLHPITTNNRFSAVRSTYITAIPSHLSPT
jgi:hypothetical protein